MHHCTEVSVPTNAAVLPEQLSAFCQAHSVSLRVPPRTGDGRVPVCPSSHLLPCVNGAQCSTAPCPPGQHQLLEQRSPPQPNPAAPEVPPPPTGAPRSDAGMSAGLGAPRAPPPAGGTARSQLCHSEAAFGREAAAQVDVRGCSSQHHSKHSGTQKPTAWSSPPQGRCQFAELRMGAA